MTLLLMQIAIVLMMSIVCGEISVRMGQAKVTGAIVGGILLGPSLFGRIAPQSFNALFAPSTLSSLDVLSTAGLILFLFMIGSEVSHSHAKREGKTAALASLMSIILPFALAILAAPMLQVRFADASVKSLPFALFLGISMSITAFPVLARILEERKLQSTRLGTTAIMCAAVDDVVAWSLLAFALALLPKHHKPAVLVSQFWWLAVYVAGMVWVIRPLAAWYGRRHGEEELSITQMCVMMVAAFLSAAVTSYLGVHPLFGAFLAGLCFPRVKMWQTTVRVRLDVVVSTVLLPMFFALTGMRTRLDLFVGAQVWGWTAVVIGLAIVGKMGGAILAARSTGHDWRNSFALGALLNTRGLVELVVLNIAYDAHVFSPTLFTMLVVMALVTTMMTVPLLNLLQVGTGVREEHGVAVTA